MDPRESCSAYRWETEDLYSEAGRDLSDHAHRPAGRRPGTRALPCLVSTVEREPHVLPVMVTSAWRDQKATLRTIGSQRPPRRVQSRERSSIRRRIVDDVRWV